MFYANKQFWHIVTFCLFVLPPNLSQGLPGTKAPDLYAFGLP